MRRTALLAAVAGALVAAPLAVFASHQFLDVPASHTFHASIGWMSDNGITVGCNPPANDRYCPDEFVTRAQMSAFLKRLAENQVVDAATVAGSTAAALSNPTASAQSAGVAIGAQATTLAQLTIDAPAAGGLIIDGYLTNEGGQSGGAYFWFQMDDTACDYHVDQLYSVAYGVFSPNGGFDNSSAHGTAMVSGGNHTVTLCGTDAGLGPVVADVTLIAEYVTELLQTGGLS